MNRKTSIILSIILVVLVLSGLAFYQYSVSNTKGNLKEENNSENIEPTNSDSNQNNNEIQVQAEGVTVESSNNMGNTGTQGGLIVCVDKCGDGICQEDNTCDPEKFNCVCQETVLECPQDCKK